MNLSAHHHHHPICAPEMNCTPRPCAPEVSTVDKDGISYINDPANHRQIQVNSNGPGLDVNVYDTSTNPPTKEMSSWGDPHDVSRNGVTTDSHGARTFKFQDGSTLNLGTRNADGTEPRPGQGGAPTFNSSAVYIPGNRPDTAAVVTQAPGQAPKSNAVTGSIDFIQSLKKEPAQAIGVGPDGNFRTPDGRILTQEQQDAHDIIKGGPAALQLAGMTSAGMRAQAGSQAWSNHTAFQHMMHTSMMCQIANRFHNGGGFCNSLNFLYSHPELGGYHQQRIMMADTAYQRQLQAEQAHRYLQNMAASPFSPSFDHHWGYAGGAWQHKFPGILAMSWGYELH